MATFKYYNLQVLPLDPKENDDIGEEGYRELFKSLRKSIRKVRTDSKLKFLDIAHYLTRDYYFTFYDVFVRNKEYAHGTCLKFDQLEVLTDTDSGEVVQELGPGISGKRFEFDFLFDYERHILAIANTENRLPGGSVLCRALKELTVGHANHLFPEYVITVNELTSKEGLEKVLRAKTFKNLDIEVHFANSKKSVSELEKSFRDVGAVNSRLIQSSEKDGVMVGLSQLATEFAQLALHYGNATIPYYSDKGKAISYHMRDYPIKTNLRKRKNQTDKEYEHDIRSSIRDAVSKSDPK